MTGRSCFRRAALDADKVGIYALFGAFVFGAHDAAGRPTRPSASRSRSKPPPVVLLLPLFFVSGLNTKSAS
ncbi:MAG: hypothetical protein IPP07_14075 [Holophagales bacterium]|nr:hypothetical protein [Holophagales bacterium]